MPHPLRQYHVKPSIPPALEPLVPLAYNLYWEWDTEAVDLFRRLDVDLWEASNNNPVLMLGQISQERLLTLSHDDGYLAQMHRVSERLARYLKHGNEWPTDPPVKSARSLPYIAYFSMEFGLTECLQIYSGGLGILAGDHLKSASDLRLPLVGVGLLYQQGYFRQYLNTDGWQQERYPQNDFSNLPIQLVSDAQGEPLTITVEFPGRSIITQIWKAQVGRIPLYLLDTNLPANPPSDRAITDQLYGGDNEKRIQQEIILGLGGVRALQALGVNATIFHMNEGHSAFLAIERIYQAIQSQGLTFDEARVIVSAGSVFTTHTPVSAGSDYFPPDLVDRYFGHYYSKLGISRWEFLALGRQNPYNEGEEFCTTVLAFRLGTLRFGVSRLHGKVSRRIWHGCWPQLSEEEVPIAHVTNGIHPATWTSFDFADLFDRYLGPRWREAPQDPKVWSGISHIPDEVLWGLHERHRERLISFTRNRLRQQRLAAGATASDVEKAGEVLRPDALTIGFARRFATYKRAYLIFSEPERLARLLNDPSHPMQIIITGKAHPRDDAGKALIRDIVHLSQRPEFARSVVFLEDYDMTISRYLFQGADVWLNNPRRPFEASGTSGMKAAINGVLNVSILDGWWDEAYRPEIGWAIGHGEEMADEKQQDRLEAAALYHLLESEVKPLFYQRGDDNLPRQWIIRMKAAMRLLGPYYNTNRMVLDYLCQGYTPAAKRVSLLSNKNTELARRIAAWRHQIWENWSKVRVERVSCSLDGTIQVGQSFTVEALISLDPLSPSDVSVQVVEGPLDSKGNIAVANAIPMLWDGRSQNPYHFAVEVPTSATGQHGFTVRVMPHHPNDPDPYATGVLTWADDATFS